MKLAKYGLAAGIFLLSSSISAANFTFVFTDTNDEFGKRGWMASDSLYQRNFRAAGALLGNLLDSNAQLTVAVVVDTSYPRFSGGLFYGRFAGMQGPYQIWEPSTLARTTNNTSSATTDIRVTVNPAFSDTWYWPDTNPETRKDIAPRGKTDLVSIVMHEMVHALGVTSRRLMDAQNLGNYSATDITRSSYDLLTAFAGDGNSRKSDGSLNTLQFTGPEAVLLNGGPLKLTSLPTTEVLASQNFSHIGDCSDIDALRKSLMSGCYVPTDGSRLKVTPLDLALIADMGYPVRSVFFPDSGKLVTSIKLGATRYAAWLQLVDAATYTFELKGTSLSNRYGSDASYDAVSGNLTMTNLVLNDTVIRYAVTLQAVPGSQPMRFRLTALTQAN